MRLLTMVLSHHQREAQVTATAHISEIVREDTGEVVPPLEEWSIEVIERGLSKDLGDLGGREPFVANARVRVIQPDGSAWTGLTQIQE